MDLTHKIRTSIFWFRRDLRLDDNHGLFKALENKNPVIPIFIFDKEILSKLEDKSDARISFIHNQLAVLKKKLNDIGSDILVFHTSPINAFKKLIEDYEIDSVYTNKDYEPYAKERDSNISHFLNNHHITLKAGTF